MDILTVTPNPSLDLLHDIRNVAWDDANRVEPPRRRPGGQGINVARAARALGGTPHVLAPFGGWTGAEIVAALESEGISYHATAVAGETRIFSALREQSSGRSLLINPRGPGFSQAEVTAFREAVTSEIRAKRPQWVACCGSLPPGFAPSFYADLGERAAESGARFVADCDGDALRLAADRGCDLLVPNRFEAERLTGRSIGDIAAADQAARALVDRGTPMVVITLGALGAVFASPERSLHARVAAPEDGPAVGAGDSLLAAFLLELERSGDVRNALAAGVASGTSVLYATGSDLVDVARMQTLRNEVELAELNR